MECHNSDKLSLRKLSHRHSGFRHRTLTRTSTMAPHITRCLLLTFFMCILFSSIYGCNIDTTRPVFYQPPNIDSGGEDYSDSLFGYSVLQHKASTNEYLLVGAPTAHSYFLDFPASSLRPNTIDDVIEKPGVLFRCFARSPLTCFEINLDESANDGPVGPEFVHRKQNAWIGASLTRQPTKPGDDLSDITVCGPRYANDYYSQYAIPTVNTTFDPNDRFPNGICYTMGHRNGDLPLERPQDVSTTIPCAGYNQTDGINTRIHGWCQAGMSAQYTSDGKSIMLGAPGSYNWTGTVFEGNKADLDFKPLADTWGQDNDYIGYAVTSGNFISKDSVQGVTSAPRAMRMQKEITTGKVIIYNLDTQEVYQELYGDLMNTYYGSAVTAVDLNNDGWCDLLVGAPLYSVNQDEGRVYVYVNNGRGRVEPMDFLLSGKNAFGARFGSAIASAGDLNNDGFNDIVIGAPWEDDNTGAVYVYFGSKDGVQGDYKQRLAGKDFVSSMGYDTSVPEIKSFGMSLDGGSDMDLNGLPDIVVGAAASELVVLFKTRPVANMKVWLVMDPDPMDPDLQNCNLDGKPVTCVTVSVCFFYEASSTPPTMDMDITLTVDYYRVADGLDSRFYFLENDTPVNSFYDLVVARYDQEACYPYKAYLEKNALDFLNPLAFHLYFGIHEYEYEPPRGDNPEKFVGGLPPIIDEDICGNGTYIDQLKFIQDCGSDAVCQTDLQLTSSVIFPTGESFFTVGSYSRMWIEADVQNTVEEAHNAKVVVRHSKEIVFEGLEESKSSCVTDDSVSADDAQCSSDIVVTCQPLESVNNTAVVECSLGTRDPMKPMTSQFLRLRFDVGAVTYANSKGTLDITVEATTISVETVPSNNVYKPFIPIKIEADTTMFGKSEPLSVYYETNKTSSDLADIALMEALIAVGVVSVEEVEDMRTDYEIAEVMINNTEEFKQINENDIGPPFSLSFTARNEGPGRLPFNSIVYVSIPWRHSNGDWLIYIKDIKTSGTVPGTCNGKELLALQELRLEEHYVNRTTTPRPESDLERVYDGAYGVETSKSGSQLACSNSMCVTLKCAINVPLFNDDNFKVTVEALLWVPTFLESELYLQVKEVISQSAIEIAAPEGIQTQPVENNPDYVDLSTGIFTDKPPSQPVAWWIILISILGGILLLILIILFLWKCGFFKREQKDELEKLQQAANI